MKGCVRGADCCHDGGRFRGVGCIRDGALVRLPVCARCVLGFLSG